MPLDFRDGDTYRWFQLRSVTLTDLASQLRKTLPAPPKGYAAGQRTLARTIARLVGTTEKRGRELVDRLREQGLLVHHADRNYTEKDPGVWLVNDERKPTAMAAPNPAPGPVQSQAEV